MCECKVTIISDDDADNIADSFRKPVAMPPRNTNLALRATLSNFQV